jgi:hypothetical protein
MGQSLPTTKHRSVEAKVDPPPPPHLLIKRNRLHSHIAMSFPGLALQRTWHLVDATNQTVGRLATTIAPILRGKHKPTFRPNGDCGDYVVIINADKVSIRYHNILMLIHYFFGWGWCSLALVPSLHSA